MTEGAVSAHLYLVAGTYTVTLSVYYGAILVANKTVGTVTVTAPDTQWPGTATLAVSNGIDFSTAPAGCDQLPSTSDWESIITYARSGGPHAPYGRIVLFGGDTFVADVVSGHNLNYSGPGYIGTYPGFGTGNATISVTYALSGVDNALGISAGTGDWRIAGLTITGNASLVNYVGISASSGIGRITVYNCTISGVNTHIKFDGCGNEVLVQGNTLSAPAGTAAARSCHGVKLGGGSTANVKYHALIDNNVALGNTDVGQAYAARFFQQNYSLAMSNTLNPGDAASASPAFGALKLGADISYSGPTTIAIYNIVCDNTLVRTASGTGTLGTGVNTINNDERMQDLIVERNYFSGMSGDATNDHPVCNVPLPNVTVRNNLFAVTKTGAAATGGYCVWSRFVASAGVSPITTNVWVYGNSAFSSDPVASAQWQFFRVETSNVGTFYVKNNAAYVPNATGPLMIKDSSSGAATIVQSNNTTDSGGSPQITNTNAFVNATPVTAAQFAPANYAVAGGTALSGWLQEDYNAALRTGAIDIGAIKNP